MPRALIGKKARQFLQPRLAFLAACAALCLIHFSGLAAPLDHTLSAMRMRMIQRAPSNQVVIVTIDSQSLRAAGEWPWPRERVARVIANLRDAGANLIAFDVDFSVRSSPLSDAALEKGLGASPGSIVLPTFLQRWGDSQNTPLAAFSRNAVYANVNIPLDPDGHVRRYWRGRLGEGDYQASMGSILAAAPYGDTSSFLIDYGIRADEIKRVSFQDVYQGTFDSGIFKGRNVIIGSTALELGDEYATPLAPALPGVVIHALAAESLIQNRALLSFHGSIALAIGVASLFALWPGRKRRPLHIAIARHGAMFVLAFVAPLVIQAYAPLSVNMGLPLSAQAIAVWVGTQRELRRRAAETLHERETRLAYAARHDPETDLPNRRALLDDVAMLLEDQQLDAVAVMTIGIDRFTNMRGAIGYVGSNEAVEQLAAQVRESLGMERVYHISMSILAVIFTTYDGNMDAFARRALKRINTRVRVGRQDLDLSLRAGVGYSAAVGASAESLLEQATLALEAARAEKHGVKVFEPRMWSESQYRLSLASDTVGGLERGEFHLVYQPKVSADTGALVGVEALTRWRHPKHGSISPAIFIALAEETGAIDTLTRWALQQAVADQIWLRGQGVNTPIAVNISARMLSDREFCDFAVEIVRKTGAILCFEITETAIIEDPVRAFASIREFKAAGVKISIDDYGSGLSSLSYLRQIDADELKLDRGLIPDLAVIQRDRLILKSTIDLAHSLGLSVVAEGVEDNDIKSILIALGCDAIQGFLISEPVHASALIDRFREPADERVVSLFKGHAVPH